MQLLAVAGVVADGLVAGSELHIAKLALAGELKSSIRIPVVSIAPFLASAASE
jgi:hypothetical protein